MIDARQNETWKLLYVDVNFCNMCGLSTNFSAVKPHLLSANLHPLCPTETQMSTSDSKIHLTVPVPVLNFPAKGETFSWFLSFLSSSLISFLAIPKLLLYRVTTPPLRVTRAVFTPMLTIPPYTSPQGIVTDHSYSSLHDDVIMLFGTPHFVSFAHFWVGQKYYCDFQKEYSF